MRQGEVHNDRDLSPLLIFNKRETPVKNYSIKFHLSICIPAGKALLLKIGYTIFSGFHYIFLILERHLSTIYISERNGAIKFANHAHRPVI